MDDLLQEFLAETNESLSVLDVELVRFEREPSDATTLSNIFRLMHTIKGTCGFLGLPRLGSVAHAGENILGKFRDGELAVTPLAVTLILRAIDRIRELLAELEATGAEPAGSDAGLIDEINGLAASSGEPAPVEIVEAATASEAPGTADGGFPVAAELLAEIAQALGPVPAAATAPELPAPPAPAAPAKPPPARPPRRASRAKPPPHPPFASMSTRSKI